MKCSRCEGTRFVRGIFSYLWEDEVYDTATREMIAEEVEREFQDVQEDWRCVDCGWHLSEEDCEAMDVAL